MQMYDVQDDEAYMTSSNLKYTIGDTVHIKDTLSYSDNHDYNVVVTGSMMRLCGGNATITDYVYDEDEETNIGYHLDIDNDRFTWTDSMLEPVTSDAVNHPSHYNNGKIEVIDYIEDKGFGFNLGNVVKYVSRHKFKYNGKKALEDLKKARFYLNREISLYESEDL